MAAASAKSVVLTEITDSLKRTKHPFVAFNGEFAEVNVLGCVWSLQDLQNSFGWLSVDDIGAG